VKGGASSNHPRRAKREETDPGKFPDCTPCLCIGQTLYEGRGGGSEKNRSPITFNTSTKEKTTKEGEEKKRKMSRWGGHSEEHGTK